MNTNENNYRIEEMEDRAVNKSNLLKTGAVAGAMGIVGAGVAVAANHALSDNSEPATNEITEDSLLNAATTGAEETQVVVETEEHHHHHHYAEPAPEPMPGDDIEPDTTMTVDEQVIVQDSDGNYLASQTSGTIEGKAYVAQDTTGDGNVDRIYYDVNGNQQFDANEVADITSENQFAMADFGQATHTTVHHLSEDFGTPEVGGGEVSNDLDDELPYTEDEELSVTEDSAEAEDTIVDEPIEEPTPEDFADASDDFTNDADVYDFV